MQNWYFLANYNPQIEGMEPDLKVRPHHYIGFYVIMNLIYSRVIITPSYYIHFLNPLSQRSIIITDGAISGFFLIRTNEAGTFGPTCVSKKNNNQRMVNRRWISHTGFEVINPNLFTFWVSKLITR